MAEKNPALRRRRTLNGLDSVAVLPKAELLRQLAQTSLRKPRYRHGPSSGRKRLGVASYEGAEYILTVREAGEHFCEPCEQKFYIRRPSNNENAGRDRGEPHG